MPNKEKNQFAPKKVQQIDTKEDSYRLKAEDIVVPLSKEINPSHIVVQDVDEVESDVEQQPSKPLKKSQFPPLTETKPDTALPLGAAWNEPLSKEVLRAPMKEASSKDNEKIDNEVAPKENVEIIATKSGPIIKTQTEPTATSNSTQEDTYKQPSPPSTPPLKTITITKTTKEPEINPPKLLIKKVEEEIVPQEPSKPLKPHEFPPLPTDTKTANGVSIVPSNVVPNVPISSVWINPLPQTITTPDPIVRSLEKESDTKNQPKEEKKDKNKDILVVPTKDGPLPKDQIVQSQEVESKESQVEKPKEPKEKAKEKMIETKNKVKTKASETKEHIKEKTVDLKEKAETVAKRIETKIEQGAESTKEHLIHLKDTTKEKLHNMKEVAKDKFEDAKEVAKDKFEVAKEVTKEKFDETSTQAKTLKSNTMKMIKKVPPMVWVCAAFVAGIVIYGLRRSKVSANKNI